MSDAATWLLIGIGTGLLLLLPTLLLTRRLRRLLVRKHPAGAILSLYAGAMLRGGAVLLGGLVVFLALGGKNAGQFAILSYWIAILLVYVVTLVLEIHSIIRRRPIEQE